jgi:hypothetical protein
LASLCSSEKSKQMPEVNTSNQEIVFLNLKEKPIEVLSRN